MELHSLPKYTTIYTYKVHEHPNLTNLDLLASATAAAVSETSCTGMGMFSLLDAPSARMYYKRSHIFFFILIYLYLWVAVVKLGGTAIPSAPIFNFPFFSFMQ